MKKYGLKIKNKPFYSKFQILHLGLLPEVFNYFDNTIAYTE